MQGGLLRVDKDPRRSCYTKGQNIRDQVFPLPFPGPSSVLFQLLGVLMAAGKDIASIQDIMTGDAKPLLAE